MIRKMLSEKNRSFTVYLLAMAIFLAGIGLVEPVGVSCLVGGFGAGLALGYRLGRPTKYDPRY